MIKLIVYTHNNHKIQEIQAIFTDFEVGSETIEVEEDGATFEENAIKKVSARPLLKDTIGLADDSGLEVDFLNGRPGHHSARYADPPTSQNLCQKLLADMKDATDRSAQFVCVIGMRFSDGSIETVRGVISGNIALQMKGSHKFGYDPVFIPDRYSQTFAEMQPEEKNTISHRYLALQLAKEKILAYSKHS